MIMKKSIYLYFIFILLSCNEDKKYEIIKEVYFYSYEISNSDNAKIGYFEPEDYPGEALSIKSITSDGENIFLLDGYHQNIKKIDIEKGKIKISEKINNDFLSDMVYFENDLFIASKYKGIYIYNSKLTQINFIELKKYFGSEKYFYFEDNSLFLYIPDNSLSIELNRNGLGKSIEESNINVVGTRFIRNKKIDYNDLILNIEDKYFKLKRPYENTFKYFNSINIYYDDNLLSYYSIDSDSLNLYIYNLGN